MSGAARKRRLGPAPKREATLAAAALLHVHVEHRER